MDNFLFGRVLFSFWPRHPAQDNKKLVIINYYMKAGAFLRFKGFSLPEVVWQQCINRLQDELPSQQFNTWIRPLQASTDGQMLTLFAPNRFIKDFVSDKFAERISELVRELEPDSAMDVVLEIGAGARSRPTPGNPTRCRTLSSPDEVRSIQPGPCPDSLRLATGADRRIGSTLPATPRSDSSEELKLKVRCSTSTIW